jgi:hypothetical protein
MMMTISRRGIRVFLRLLLDGSCADDYVELLLRLLLVLLIYAVVILSPPLLDSNAADGDDGVLFAPVGGVLSAVVVALFVHSVYSVEKVMLYYQRHHHLRHRYYCCLYDCFSFLLFDDVSFALHNLIDRM